MEGTWGKRVYGVVERSSRITLFRLEVKLDNGCTFYEAERASNLELEQFEGLYGFILDRLTDKLDKRIKARHQQWMRQ